MIEIPKRRSSFKTADNILLRLLSEPDSDLLARAASELQAVILGRAHVHNALVLLAARARSSPYWDEPIRSELATLFRVAVAKDWILARMTVDLTRKLNDACVDTVVYKGPTLWRSLGLSAPVRISSDIDILVSPLDVSRVDAMLTGMGYRCLTRASHEATYVCTQLPVIDLHWSLISGGGWAQRLEGLHNGVWSTERTVAVLGSGVRTLSDAELMVTLLLHAGCHHLCTDWGSLYEISCASRVLRSRDWSYVNTVVERSGVKFGAYYPLKIASERFRASVPEELLDRMRPPARYRALGWIAAAGFDGRLTSVKLLRAARMIWNLLLTPNLGSAGNWIRDVIRVRLGG